MSHADGDVSVKARWSEAKLAYVYVDAGKSSAVTTVWDDASGSYVPKRLYELYIVDSKGAPEVGGQYRGGSVVAAGNAPDGNAYAAGSITLLSDADFNALSLPDKKECTEIDLHRANTSGVKNMRYMFQGCSQLATLNISGWDTSGVTSMFDMFQDCEKLKNVDVSAFDMSGVTDITQMFDGCKSMGALDVSRWDTSSVKDMFAAFRDCPVETVDVSSWDASNVTRANWMFQNCKSLSSLDVSRWDVSSLEDAEGMFASCESLASLDVSRWSLSKVEDLGSMFKGCSLLSELKTGAGWKYNASLVSKPEFASAMYDESGSEYKRYDDIPEGAHTYTTTKPQSLAAEGIGA